MSGLEADLKEFVPEDHEFRKEMDQKGIDTVEKLIGMYRDARTYISSNRNGAIPGEGSTAEEWAEYRKKIGVPDSADGYKVPDLRDHTERVSSIREVALDAGLTPEQFEKIAAASGALLDGREKEMAERTVALLEKHEADGLKEFGNDWKEMSANAKRAYAEIVGEDDGLSDLLDSTGVSSHPKIVKAFAKLAKVTGEGTMPEGNPAGGTTSSETKKMLAEAIIEGKAISADPNFRNARSPEQARLRHRWGQIQELLSQHKVGGQDGQGALVSDDAENILREYRGY